MISSDPRTWSDFSNPGAHGFAKVDCHTTLERAFVASAIAVFIIAVAIVLPARPERRLAGPDVVAFAPWLFVLAGLLLCCRWLTNNFYLVDPARHAVFYHFQFLFMRSVRLLLQRQDIFATSVETRRRRSKYRSWWEYRAVLIDTRGRVVPMGDWQKDDVWTPNNEAAELAKQLQCPCHPATEERRLVVTAGAGGPTASFEPYRLFTRHGAVQVVVLVVVLVVLGLVLLRGW